jgi:hypothetical protein
MPKYEFTIVLSEKLELTEEVADLLFESGCDDASPGTCEGAFTIDFHRSADSLEEAIQSASRNVKQAGFNIERVELVPEELPVG